MNKAVLISIRPKWCELIASGNKTIEVRKTAPKVKTPFKCYIYCTKFKPGDPDSMINLKGRTSFFMPKCGEVIGEFMCDEIKHYVTLHAPDFTPYYMKEEKSDEVSFIDFDETCLTEEDFFEYGSGNDLYGWHISNLIIYDVPKKLGDFRVTCQKAYCSTTCKRYPTCGATADWRYEITHPPQSWCYVEELS